ncbi:MAG: hypothetical protein IH991_07565, partial [Planctomycetes bacterium]|nr:hypothetical protein [Planctomycetota bacterium]
MRRRVVITGYGCINPMGHEVETMWTGLKEGKSGVGYTSIFDASRFPTRISAEVKDWQIGDSGEDPEVWRNRGRHTCFAAGAAKQAIQASGITDSELDPTRLGIYLGSGEGNQNFLCFTNLVVAALEGKTELKALLDWQQAISWRGELTLNGINTAKEFPDWPSKLNGLIKTRGSLYGGTWQMDVPELKLTGNVKQNKVNVDGTLKGNSYMQWMIP